MLFARRPQCYGVVECGFLSNWKEAALLKTEEYQDRVAYTLHMGIMEYLNGR